MLGLITVAAPRLLMVGKRLGNTMMKRRQLLQTTAAWPLMHMSAGVLAQDKWGQGQGYPTGLQGGLVRDPMYRVGNFSGGYEKLFHHNTIKAPVKPAVPYTENQFRWCIAQVFPSVRPKII